MTSRMQAVLGNESDNAVVERSWVVIPQLPGELLCTSGKDVQQIDTEHEELITQAYHLLSFQAQQTDRCLRKESTGVTLMIAEDGFWLQYIWCSKLFVHCIGMVVCVSHGNDVSR